MKIYRGFPRRLHHTVPHWVEPGALFHIRIALDREKEQRALTDPALAQVRHGESVLWRTIFDSAKFYWKRFHARTNGVIWQEGYFDHRLRADERGEQLSVKLNYIRQNPVAAGLCAKSEEWPWVIDPFGREG